MQPIPTSSIPSTSGVEVVVHHYGGDGPLLVLGHATGFCARTWDPAVEVLRASFHCVAIDFRGHGLTGLPAGVPLAWQGMAEDLMAVVDALSPGEPVLAAGHSMGGTAIILADTTRPGLFTRAWSYEPILLREAPVLTGDEGPDIAKAARARRAAFASAGEAYERYRRRPPLSLLDERALRAYIDHGFRPLDDGSVTLRCRPEYEASVFEHHNTGAFEQVAKVSMPLTVAVGGDGEGPAEWVHEAAAEHGTLDVVDYPDLTHFGPLQAPDRLAGDATRFLLG